MTANGVRKCVRWCQNKCLTYTPAHALVLKNTSLMHITPSAKDAHALVRARLCNGVEASLPWKLLRTILSLVQAACIVFAERPATVLTKSVARRCLLEKTVQFRASSWRCHRCGVAQASFVIRVDAGLIQMVYASSRRRTTERALGLKSKCVWVCVHM